MDDTYLRKIVQAARNGIAREEIALAKADLDLNVAKEVMVIRRVRREVEGLPVSSAPPAVEAGGTSPAGTQMVPTLQHMPRLCYWEDTFRPEPNTEAPVMAQHISM